MNAARFAAIQMNSADSVAENLQIASGLLDRAAAGGAVFAVLPENFAGIGPGDTWRIKHAEAARGGPIQECLAESAARTGMWIVGGTIPLASNDPGRPYASCLIFDHTGHRAGRYDKIHLFDVAIPGQNESYRESANTMPGTEPLVIETPWGGLGCAVCYDLRFPELFRLQCAEGMDFLALPAAFTEATGQAHWHSMLRARAIENLCHVVAAAQTGTHPGGRRTYGHSMIVDPWGVILAEANTMEAGKSTGYISAQIEFDRQAELRRTFPALSHRRLRIDRPEE